MLKFLASFAALSMLLVKPVRAADDFCVSYYQAEQNYQNAYNQYLEDESAYASQMQDAWNQWQLCEKSGNGQNTDHTVFCSLEYNDTVAQIQQAQSNSYFAMLEAYAAMEAAAADC
ncbi:hypothetical protein ACFSC3_02075 [Sphingomonas floccifaciens]|uniref:Uncharacterized protein n=1 Tax=Sphingomonas floccifaciens TaxID=1844115 RepID=A0ABW4NC87_9SPHN